MDREQDRGSEEVVQANTTTVIDLNNGDVYERHHMVATAGSSLVSATYISHSDSSENSLNLGMHKVSLLIIIKLD